MTAAARWGVRLWSALLSGLLVIAIAPPAAALAAGGVVTVSESGGLSPETVAAVAEVAERVGARWVVHHRGTLQLRAVTREGAVVQEAPDGFFFPMATLALDPARALPLLGVAVADVLRSGEVVFGKTSASLRGAEVGDRIEVRGWDGALYEFRIGAIVPDAIVGWAELTFSLEVAASFGFSRPASVVLWGFSHHDGLAIELGRSLPEGFIRVRTGDDPADPDGVLPTALVKKRFGEFSYRPTGRGDQVEIDPAWRQANIVSVSLPLLGPFRCHRAVVPYLRAAIAEVREAGLGGHIDRGNFQLAGGCYNARLIRGNDKGGAVSRHTWGVAIDINPSDNPYGGRVGMDPRIGAIFRRWGFAWGGGWTFPDGGHFEWNHVPEFVLFG